MSLNVLVRVPADEVQDLAQLAADLGSTDDIEVLHPFDGATVAQLFVATSSATLPLLRTWLKARVDTRKGFVIVHDGTELRGYTAAEAEEVLQSLAVHAAPDAPT